eukprot:11560744-Alexandrium_andersonii.AAC.1
MCIRDSYPPPARPPRTRRSGETSGQSESAEAAERGGSKPGAVMMMSVRYEFGDDELEDVK